MPLPPEIPVIHFASPAFGDLTLTEIWNTEVTSYIELPYGSRHPNEDKWPDYMLVRQEPLQGDEKWVMRTWMQDPIIENTFNLAKEEFDGEDVDKAVFTRTYLVRRTHYDANIPAKGSALTGVVGVRMTNSGSGYDSTTTVTLTTVSAGSGATAEPIIFRGEIVGVHITSEGINYDVAPTVSFTGPAGSAGATAIARIQPANAYLTREVAERIESQPDDGLYLKVTRVYERLPGALLVTKKIGEQGETETTNLRRALTGTVTLTPGYLVTDEALKAESTVVDVHSRTTVPSWPVLTEYDQDPEMQSLIKRTYQIVDAVAVGVATGGGSGAGGVLDARVVSSGVIREFRKMDKWRSLKVETTYSTPADYSEQRFMAYNFKTVLKSFSNDDNCGSFYNAEFGQSLMVEARLLNHFGSTKLVIGTNVSSPNYLAHRPWSNTFKYGVFSVNDVMNDAGCLEFNSTCIGCINIPASSPSGTTYLGLFNNTEQIISGESVLWKAGLYKTSVLYVMFPAKPAVTCGTCVDSGPCAGVIFNPCP